jgi:hypothetical protein
MVWNVEIPLPKNNITTMKLQYKKYLYLINDISNILLKKELEKRSEEVLHRLKTIITILSTALIISVLINIYLSVIK